VTTLKQLACHYNQQLESYRALFTFTKKLLKLTENVEMSAEEIGDLISKRQIILDSISEQEKISEPLWVALQRQLGYRPKPQRLPEIFPAKAEAKEIANSHAEIQKILKQIVTDDALIRKTLTAVCRQLQEKLHELQKQRQANRIYRTNHVDSKGVFLDSKEY